MTTSGLRLTSPTAELAEQFEPWASSTGWGSPVMRLSSSAARGASRTSCTRITPAELGWVDGYTYALLADEWRQ